MDVKVGVTHCVVISGKSAAQETPQQRPLTAKDVIRINKSSISRITTVTTHKYPHHSEIKMSACLLVIYRTTQNGPGPTKTWYLKHFQVQYTSLAQPSFGIVYNEFIQGSPAFELHQTAINLTV